MKHKELIISAVFILIGIATRTVLHLGDNIEFISACSLSVGFFLKNQKFKFIVPMLVMFISDLIIGNTIIFLFTWSAFMFAPILGNYLKKQNEKLEGNKYLNLFVVSEFGGVLFTIIFFLWTNFGVVVTSDMYEKSLAGLAQSYINALPFLTPQLLSNLIIVPFIFLLTYMALNFKPSFGNLENYKN